MFLMWFIFINEGGVGMGVGVEASMQMYPLIKHQHHHTTLSATPRIVFVCINEVQTVSAN